jgi:type II secretory ATPase GspE/PulE/Tfp pilus assembly ATPase PilB-like protein
MVGLFIADAILERAEQVHFDLEHGTVKYLRDGTWAEVAPMPPTVCNVVIDHLRQLAGLARDSGQREQVGVTKVTVADREFEVRVTTRQSEQGRAEAFLHFRQA